MVNYISKKELLNIVNKLKFIIVSQICYKLFLGVKINHLDDLTLIA